MLIKTDVLGGLHRVFGGTSLRLVLALLLKAVLVGYSTKYVK